MMLVIVPIKLSVIIVYPMEVYVIFVIMMLMMNLSIIIAHVMEVLVILPIMMLGVTVPINLSIVIVNVVEMMIVVLVLLTTFLIVSMDLLVKIFKNCHCKFILLVNIIKFYVF